MDVGQHGGAKVEVGGPEAVQTQVDEGRTREPKKGGGEREEGEEEVRLSLKSVSPGQ